VAVPAEASRAGRSARLCGAAGPRRGRHWRARAPSRRGPSGDKLPCVPPDPLASLHHAAQRAARVPSDAEDLLQDALLAGLRAGRADLSDPNDLRWLNGTIRHLATMQARSAVRRRAREEAWSAAQPVDTALAAAEARVPQAWQRLPVVDALPPALRTVALLALAGHDREEICWLLRINPVTLRQRISTLRKRLRAASATLPSDGSPADVHLPLGLIRRALLPVLRHGGGLGVPDPDGHLLSIGPPAAHVRRIGGNRAV
jgi:DNA-directed RNA polymerase specialized sigma24 family protein